MKVILAGVTGFIGGEVLSQALVHPAITSVVCLTRRALPDSVTNNPKVKVIIVKDFTSYPPDILSQLEGAEACIWALGSPPQKAPSPEEAKIVQAGYSLAAAEAFTASLAPALRSEGKPFRFEYLSGAFTERDPSKHLWFLQNARRIKGEAENGLLALQQKEGSNLEVSLARPGGVLPKTTIIPNILAGPTLSIKVDELAAAMIDEVVGDVKGTRTLECSALRTRGRELLKQ